MEYELPDLEFQDDSEESSTTTTIDTHQQQLSQQLIQQPVVQQDESNTYFCPDTYKEFKVLETKVAERVMLLQSNPLFAKLRLFVETSIVRGVFPVIEPFVTFKHAEQYDFRLDYFLGAEQLDRDEPTLSGECIGHVEDPYVSEIGLISTQMSTAKALLATTESLTSIVRPIVATEHWTKLEDVTKKFLTLLSYQKSSSCDSLLRVRKGLGALKPIKSMKRNKNRKRVTDAPLKGRRVLAPHYMEMMNQWFQEHGESPFPMEDEKVLLASICHLSKLQIDNWFGNMWGKALEVRIRF
eukprot:gene10571-12298_t